MQIILPFDSPKPISGVASIEINQPAKEVFRFVADDLFVNYPKWAAEVIELQPLDGGKVFVGAKAKQIKKANDDLVESIFEITEYKPDDLTLIFQGLTEPYKHTYVVEPEAHSDLSRLTFKFELLEVEIVMRPFVKLIRVAIEDGVENTVVTIKDLLTQACH